MDWEQFWDKLITEKKLGQLINETDKVDKAKGHVTCTKEICHRIYDDYLFWRKNCLKIKREILDIIEGFDGVHLQTSRIKSLESLIVKVIEKRHAYLADDTHKYATIDVENYKDIITDLIGIRVIINFRGRWEDIHGEILSAFEMFKEDEYTKDQLLPHMKGRKFIAEIPKAYYAGGDDISRFKAKGLDVKLHKKNYRSIHYVISFEETYIELQVRTIYDEAWSDCDHNYVYKQDSNHSHVALENMSLILSKLTNLSNDIGDKMKEIFESESIIINPQGDMVTSDEVSRSLEDFFKRLCEIEEDFKSFNQKILLKGDIWERGGGVCAR